MCESSLNVSTVCERCSVGVVRTGSVHAAGAAVSASCGLSGVCLFASPAPRPVPSFAPSIPYFHNATFPDFNATLSVQNSRAEKRWLDSERMVSNSQLLVHHQFTNFQLRTPLIPCISFFDMPFLELKRSELCQLCMQKYRALHASLWGQQDFPKTSSSSRTLDIPYVANEQCIAEYGYNVTILELLEYPAIEKRLLLRHAYEELKTKVELERGRRIELVTRTRNRYTFEEDTKYGTKIIAQVGTFIPKPCPATADNILRGNGLHELSPVQLPALRDALHYTS